MGFRTPDLGYSEVFEGIKSSTFGPFRGGVHFWTTFCPVRVRSRGPGSDPNNGKMKVFGVFRTSEMGPSRVPEWVQNGSFWGTSRYFEVLLSLLKRFISLLRARAKVYSILGSDPNPQGATHFGPLPGLGGPRDDPISGVGNMAKSLILPFNGSRGPDPGRTRNGPKVVQKWSKSGHFGAPNPGFGPQIGSFRGSRL